MEGPASTRDSQDTVEQRSPPSESTSPSIVAAEIIQSDSATDSQDNGTAKRTKHNRVHKREKELCGLVTPLYLPLLEANNSPRPTAKHKEKRKQKDMKNNGVENSAPDSGHAPSSQSTDKGRGRRISKDESGKDKVESELSGDQVHDNTSQSTSVANKKSRRPAVRKSSLRGSDSPRARRKRVSIVIDDQIVLPADNIVETVLISPSETSASVTPDETSPADDVIDPELMDIDRPPGRQEPVRHSLPFPIRPPSTSPTKHTNNTLSESPLPTVAPPQQYTTRTYLDPSPADSNPRIPQQSSADPIYADRIELAEKEEEENLVGGDVDSHNFDTYVGGMSGSGVDNVNQSGSYGYPSSLGASYLESYMKSRPLSVRLAAAEKAGLKGEEKKGLVQGDGTHHQHHHHNHSEEEAIHVDTRPRKIEREEDEEMDVIGSMDGF
jgi:predicted small lipoprotein YifL